MCWVLVSAFGGWLRKLGVAPPFSGVDVAWPDLDVDHYLPYLLEGKYASDRWKQARKQQEIAAA